jgi:hypothetical protein
MKLGLPGFGFGLGLRGVLAPALRAAAIAARDAAAGTSLIWIEENLSNAWQDLAATVPCTAAGQPLQAITGPAGGTFNLVGVSVAGSPTLQRTANGWCAQFDGVDDQYVHSTNFFVSGDDVDMVVAGVPAVTGAVNVVAHCGHSTVNARYPYLFLAAGGTVRTNWRGDDTVLTAVNAPGNVAGNPVVMTSTKVATALTTMVSGTVTAGSATVGSIASLSRLRFGGDATGASFYTGTQALWCVSKTLTGPQLAAIERYGAYLVGGIYYG